MRAYLKRHWPLLVGALIALAAYWRWLNFGTFVHGDWSYQSAELLRSYLVPSAWNADHGFGGPNLFLWRAPYAFAQGVVAFVIGGSSSVADKLFVFWPLMVFLPYAGYRLARTLVTSRLAAFVGSLAFAYNTYFLSIDTQGHMLITLASAFAALSLATMLPKATMGAEDRILIARSEGPQGRSEDGGMSAAGAPLPQSAYRSFVIAGLWLAAAGALDFRVAYLACGMLALAALMHREWRIVVTFVTFGMLNVFWVLPTVMTGTLASNGLLGRPLFGDEFWNFASAVTLTHPFWNGGAPKWFIEPSVPLFAWIVPALAVAGAAFARKNRTALFFAAVAIVGMFLAKQTDPPFGGTYAWLYDHAPGFSAFREATKFYVPIAMAYAALIAACCEGLLSVRLPKRVPAWAPSAAALLVGTFFLVNAAFLAAGRMGAMFVPATTTGAYDGIAAALGRDHAFSRVLGIPATSPWIPYGNAHPKVSVSDLGGQLRFVGRQGDDPLSESGTSRLLALGGVKTVVMASGADVPMAVFGYENVTRTNAEEKRLITLSVTNARPHLYLTDEDESLKRGIEFEEADVRESGPDRYVIEIGDHDAERQLQFADRFHPDWHLYEGDVGWLEVLLGRHDVTGDRHFENAAGMNAYRLAPGERGTFTLAYRPQAFLLLGCAISGAALAACLAFLVYPFAKRKIISSYARH